MRERINIVVVLGGLWAAQIGIPSHANDLPSYEIEIDRSASTFRFAGVITANSVKEFQSQTLRQEDEIRRAKPWLLIDSPGGEADALITLSNFVDSKFAGVIVPRRCYSACAELLITIEKPVLIAETASVKYHINPVLARELVADAGLDVPDCILHRAEWYERNFSASLSAVEWSAIIRNALEFRENEPRTEQGEHGCPNYVFQSKGRFLNLTPQYLAAMTNGRIQVLGTP
ncbi:hypothetical protein MACH24_30980 [Erythrobacter sp. Dej080120_24]|uniref:hypothetical protein n=1 Tax=Erythrobacter sp. Dej080120_24 TaxID=3024837 RepID=UPI0029237C3B|nr:hypothetical protein MACH24_30980 [Erythrobacter sp. Dej080120_24]